MPQAHITNPANVSECFHQQHITIIPLPTPSTHTVDSLHIAPDHAADGGALLCSVVAGHAPIPLLGDRGMLVAHAGGLRLLTWQCVQGPDDASTLAGAPDLAMASTAVAVHGVPVDDRGHKIAVQAAMHVWSWDPEALVRAALASPWGPDVRLADVAVDVLLAPPLTQSACTHTAPQRCSVARAVKCARADGTLDWLQQVATPQQPPVQLLVAALASACAGEPTERVALLDVELDPVSGAAAVVQLGQVHAKQGVRWSTGTRQDHLSILRNCVSRSARMSAQACYGR